jgi:teichuronic acid biosynthesis glycosyltransferase TuaC
MRIGLLTTSFPRHDRDSAGCFVLGFARALCAEGHQVDVLAPEPREPQTAPGWPAIDVHHVAYLRPRALQRTFYSAGVPDNLARDPTAWLGLAPFSIALTREAHRRAGDWNAMVSHWALPCALAAGMARRQKPHLAVLHSADVHWLARLPLRAQLATQIARSATALWFVTQQQRDRFLELLPSAEPKPHTLVCPMGVELPQALEACDREQLRRRYGLQGFSVLSLGRLVPIKGVDVAIRAVAACGVTLLLAGAGPEHSRLCELAGRLHADVRFFGEVSGQQKSELFRVADAFVLPSRRLLDGRSEGLPIALLEAMMYRLPIVASNLPGIAELLSEPPLNRWLVPADQPQALANALHRLRSSAHERTAAANACRVTADRHTWQRVAARALRVLDS